MRVAIALIVFAAGLHARAQVWCPPGAEWTYGFGNQQASGITRAWYSGDSLVGGYNAQRIDQTIHAYQPNPPFGQPFTQELEPLFTRSENEVVYIWDGVSSTYDTLIWFGAVPGQRWNLHHQDGFTWFNVLDTGTSVVQGIPLHYLVVEEPNFLFATDTIRERIGPDLFYIDPMETLIVDWTTGWLRCYRDDVVDEFHGQQWFGQCDFTVSVPDKETVVGLPSPNPGTSHFTLQIPGGMHTIEVFDATGRRMMNGTSGVSAMSVSTGAWPPGIYTVLMRSDRGHASALRWVKE